MNNPSVDILDYYDEEVIKMITEKYGFEQMQALRIFLNSETYKLLSDAELEMWEFGPAAIFDMWENEKITGNTRNSLYLSRDECV